MTEKDHTCQTNPQRFELEKNLFSFLCFITVGFVLLFLLNYEPYIRQKHLMDGDKWSEGSLNPQTAEAGNKERNVIGLTRIDFTAAPSVLGEPAFAENIKQRWSRQTLSPLLCRVGHELHMGCVQCHAGCSLHSLRWMGESCESLSCQFLHNPAQTSWTPVCLKQKPSPFFIQVTLTDVS